MKNLIKTLATLIFLSSFGLFAEDVKCDNNSSCVASNYFIANVEKISKRGKIVIVQVKYLSKVTYFDVDFKKGYAILLDNNGNEFKVDGKNISEFRIGKGNFRVLSLKFRGSDKMQINTPFDLTIKASNEHGEITFFDLNIARKK
ncbi:hypothetical protein CRYPA_1417 [uncultured Candidatus Thioglobus sp.]|nr:hypothetical protein CRYPA_1417 [uncultured Candidatus Thioglobus sp.]